MLGHLYEVGRSGCVSFGLQTCWRMGGSSHVLSGTDVARIRVLLAPHGASFLGVRAVAAACPGNCGYSPWQQEQM